MVKKTLFALIIAFLTLTAFADYKFEVVSNYSTYDIQTDGSAIINYKMTFKNIGQPIDVVDIGLPDDNYVLSSAQAFVNGAKLEDIRKSEYVAVGVEVHLGQYQILPGNEGTLEFSISSTNRVFDDDKDPNYASTEFMTTFYGSQYTEGTTRLGCQFTLPPGVLPEEPRYHTEPPTKSFVDDKGRVVYQWIKEGASPSEGYTFGASFPRKYVTNVTKKPHTPAFIKAIGGLISGFFQLVFGNIPCFCIFFFVGSFILSAINAHRRKMKYLPAEVGIDGVEVRRGLTVPEVAALLEEPLNKILALILFGMIRKGQLKVVTQKPLKLEKIGSAPLADLSYEKQFLLAVEDDGIVNEKEAVTILTDLVKKVGEKMKGFSRKKSIEYYRQIMKKAWDEVGKDDYSESFEWLILDKNFEDEAERRYPGGRVPVPIVFGPIFHPTSTGGYSGGSTGAPIPSSGTGQSGGGIVSSANAIVSGVEGFSNNLAGSLPGLATQVTSKTNPVPVSTGGGSSSGGGHCACACACAGCACACAGGGR